MTSLIFVNTGLGSRDEAQKSAFKSACSVSLMHSSVRTTSLEESEFTALAALYF